MSQPFDGFGDIIQRESGILDGPGLRTYDNVSHQLSGDGLVVEVCCEECGFTRHVLISWPELIALKYNVSPHEAYQGHPQLAQFASPWRLPSQQAINKGVALAWFPDDLRCRCGAQFGRPHITPGECEGHLAVARQRGYVHMGQEKPISQVAFQRAKSLGRI